MATTHEIGKRLIIRAENAKFLINEYRFKLFPAMDFIGRSDVYGNLPEDNGRMIIYASCDQIYFDRFAAAFIKSTMLSNPTALIHLHVVDPAPRALKDFDEWHTRFPALSFTFEGPLLERLPVEFRRCYYASIRFIRVLDILQTCPSSVFCFDIDTIIRGSLESILITEPKADVLLPLRPNADDFRCKLIAGAVLLRRTERTSKFIFRLASRLQRHLNSKTTTWGIDQQCLYYTLSECEVDYKNLPAQYLDCEFKPESLVWSAKGDQRKVDNFSEALLRFGAKSSTE